MNWNAIEISEDKPMLVLNNVIVYHISAIFFKY